MMTTNHTTQRKTSTWIWNWKKPIDAKKTSSENPSTNTAKVGASTAEVSPSSGVSATPKSTGDTKPKQQSAPAAQVSTTPLITPAVSSVPSLPPSIFMPITTASTSSGPLLTSSAKPLGTQPVSLPATADLAGIVKLIGATLKQTNVPGQVPVGGAQNTQTTTAQGPTTGSVQGAATTTTRAPSSAPQDTQNRSSEGTAEASRSSKRTRRVQTSFWRTTIR